MSNIPGSDYIALIIVPVVLLAGWLLIVFYSANHPQWGEPRTERRGISLTGRRDRQSLPPADGPDT